MGGPEDVVTDCYDKWVSSLLELLPEASCQRHPEMLTPCNAVITARRKESPRRVAGWPWEREQNLIHALKVSKNSRENRKELARKLPTLLMIYDVQAPLKGTARKLEGRLRGPSGAAGDLQEMSLREATFCKRLSPKELTSYASSLAQLSRSQPGAISAAKAVASASLPQVDMFDPSDLAKVASALCRLDHFEGAWQLYARVQRCAPGVAGLQDLRGETNADEWVSEWFTQLIRFAVYIPDPWSLFGAMAPIFRRWICCALGLALLARSASLLFVGCNVSGPRLRHTVPQAVSEDDMKVLRDRIDDLKKRPLLPIIMVDSMLPGQRLVFSASNPELEELAEEGLVGVIGPQRSGSVVGVSAKLRAGSRRAPNECHADDAPDAKEPADGPGDGMAVLENNLGAAIEVADFLQKEQEEVEREKCAFAFSHQRLKKTMEDEFEKNAINRTIVFEGQVLPGTGKCVCSWPGKYESAWDALVTGSRSGNISAAVVFLPEGSMHFGSHDVIPKEEKLQGRCWCVPLYGERKEWGCRWWTKWIANIETAHREGAEMEVYFFKGLKGKGKVRNFSTAGEEHLRRERIQAKKHDFLQSQSFSDACDEGIEGLSKEPRFLSELKAEHVFKVVSEAQREGTITRAKVEFLHEEVKEEDVLLAEALVPLIEEWTNTLVENQAERYEGQLQDILKDLGQMPPPTMADKLAMWAAALVNPLPALGVALEIRPAVLQADSLQERILIVRRGIRGSIEHAMLWMSELHPGHLPRAIMVLSHLTIFPRVARSPTWRVTLGVAAVLLLWRQLGVSAALASRTALQASGERSHRQVAGALEQRLDDLLLGQEARAASMQQGARHRRQLPVQKPLSKEAGCFLGVLRVHRGRARLRWLWNSFPRERRSP
eukprot:s2935_g3.t1